METHQTSAWFAMSHTVITDYAALIGPHALAVYAQLCHHANAERQCWPSYTAIARMLNISRRKVIYSINRLILVKLVSKEKAKDPNGLHDRNTYRLLPARALSVQDRAALESAITESERGGARDAPGGSAEDAPDSTPGVVQDMHLVHQVHEGGAPGAMERESWNKNQDSTPTEYAPAGDTPPVKRVTPPPPPREWPDEDEDDRVASSEFRQEGECSAPAAPAAPAAAPAPAAASVPPAAAPAPAPAPPPVCLVEQTQQAAMFAEPKQQQPQRTSAPGQKAPTTLLRQAYEQHVRSRGCKTRMPGREETGKTLHRLVELGVTPEHVPGLIDGDVGDWTRRKAYHLVHLLEAAENAAAQAQAENPAALAKAFKRQVFEDGIGGIVPYTLSADYQDRLDIAARTGQSAADIRDIWERYQQRKAEQQQRDSRAA